MIKKNNINHSFVRYFKQNLNENVYDDDMVNRLAMALARYGKEQGTEPGAVFVDPSLLPSGLDLEDEIRAYSRDRIFRKTVATKVKKYLRKGSYTAIEFVDPDRARDDRMDKFKDHYRTKERGIKESFEETPFGQIVADEVNKVVSNLPEMQLARDVLSEQETQDIGRNLALNVLGKVREKMAEDLPKMVDEMLKKVLAEMDR